MNLQIPKRYQLLSTFGLVFLMLSFIVRISLYIWSFPNIEFSIINVVRIFATGLFFDLGTVSFFLLPYTLYLFALPNKLHGSKLDKIVTNFAFFIGSLIFIFSTFAEFTFWEEFSTRFNFIAVDYLVYTNEVVGNINESYPLPILLSIVIGAVALIIFVTKKKKVFLNTFSATSTFKERLFITLPIVIVPLLFFLFITNKNAEWSGNRYENELSKTGIHSFFAAFRNNELSYTEFYLTQDLDESIKELKKNIIAPTDSLISQDKYSFKRLIKNEGEEQKPNVIFICI
ncbi:MAG: hypothetical protein QMB65_05220 [Vicingaceae bacterium]